MFSRDELSGALTFVEAEVDGVGGITGLTEVRCMFWNETTATSIGFLVAGIAYWVTGKHHALDGAAARPSD